MSHLTLTITSCEFTYLKEVSKSILNVILFHRLFNQIVPKTHELLDLTIPCVDDPLLEQQIDEKATSFVKSTDPKRLIIEFYEKKTRKNWWMKTEEEICWESWTVQFELVPPSRTESERRQNLKGLEKSLEGAIMRVLQLVNDRNEGYIPMIPYGEGNPFPYQIYYTSR